MPFRSDELRVAHSSDLHVDEGFTMRAWGGDGNAPLAAVIEAAVTSEAHVLVLAGDVFEHNRLKLETLEASQVLLSNAPIPIVMLPGNHDPLTSESVWFRGNFMDIENVFVIGTDNLAIIHLPDIELAVWGRAHTSYDDMDPLNDPPKRPEKFYMALAHGHYTSERPSNTKPHASWLITPENIQSTEADYVALGHWNFFTPVGESSIPASYSGSPDHARTINLVRLRENNLARIERVKVNFPSDASYFNADETPLKIPTTARQQ
tara:strand:+ start:141 stop:932 length:792 start_codon:yes stop_codon:yes gene_type:complete